MQIGVEELRRIRERIRTDDAAASNVVRFVALRQSAQETSEQYVKRLAGALLDAMIETQQVTQPPRASSLERAIKRISGLAEGVEPAAVVDLVVAALREPDPCVTAAMAREQIESRKRNGHGEHCYRDMWIAGVDALGVGHP